MTVPRQDLLVVFLGSIVFFGSIYQLTKSLLHKLIQRDGFALEPKHLSILVSHGPSYACSMIHSFITGYRGIMDSIGFSGASPETKLFFPPTPKEYIPFIRSVALTNAFFFAYLAQDLFHVVRMYPKLGGIDIVVHHLVFMTCSLINGGFQILPYPFTWLILGELSTIFLNIRWLLIKTGRGRTLLFQIIQSLFALTFFLTRVVIYSFGVMELFQQRDLLKGMVADGRVPGIFMVITLSFVGAGSALNLVWFQKIAALVISKQSKKETKSS